MYIADPLPAGPGRWPDPRVVGNTAVTQGLHVRAVKFDPCAELISSTDGPVARDEDVDVVRHALEQPQRGEIVLDRISGTHVEHRDQDIRKHVAGGENPALLHQQCRWPWACARCSMIRTLGPSQGICVASAGRPAMRPSSSS